MLAANEAVARWFGEKELPTIYRVHGLPDEEKLEAFRALAETHGFAVPEGPIGPKQLNALLEGFRGHAQERALSQLLLRAMMQALYSPENIGHFGLAAEHYLHFTSPIRRYPDLVVHRLLRETQAGRGGGDAEAPRRSRRRRPRGEEGEAPRSRDLEETAALASERERAAMQSEREIAAFYAALFMKDHVGERFAGIVASVVEFGLFVELKDHFVEGLVKAEDLGVGLQLDPKMHALVDRARGRAFRVGDEVEVEVLNSSPARRQIDLALVEGGRTLRAAREWPGGRREDRGGRREERDARRGSRESRRAERKQKRRRDR
jgi:ribonuclease R